MERWTREGGTPGKERTGNYDHKEPPDEVQRRVSVTETRPRKSGVETLVVWD